MSEKIKLASKDYVDKAIAENVPEIDTSKFVTKDEQGNVTTDGYIFAKGGLASTGDQGTPGAVISPQDGTYIRGTIKQVPLIDNSFGDDAAKYDGSVLLGGADRITLVHGTEGSSAVVKAARSFIWCPKRTPRTYRYSNHGVASFNIDPDGGADGVWIGEKALPQIIKEEAQEFYGLCRITESGTIQKWDKGHAGMLLTITGVEDRTEFRIDFGYPDRTFPLAYTGTENHREIYEGDFDFSAIDGFPAHSIHIKLQLDPDSDIGGLAFTGFSSYWQGNMNDYYSAYNVERDPDTGTWVIDGQDSSDQTFEMKANATEGEYAWQDVELPPKEGDVRYHDGKLQRYAIIPRKLEYWEMAIDNPRFAIPVADLSMSADMIDNLGDDLDGNFQYGTNRAGATNRFGFTVYWSGSTQIEDELNLAPWSVTGTTLGEALQAINLDSLSGGERLPLYDFESWRGLSLVKENVGWIDIN